MALLISTPQASLFSSSSTTKPALYHLSSSSISFQKTPKDCHFICRPLLGLGPFSQWSGLKHMGISITLKSIRKERKTRCKGMVVLASLFGVGAPEALVIGVVALLVFGPKGLAEVARNLGKTLRAFQPTIRELQEVSREFKSTLEREIGLDEPTNQMQNTYNSNTTNTASSPSSVSTAENPPIVADPNGSVSSTGAYTSEEYLKVTEEQLKASSAAQQQPPGESQLEPQNQSQETAPAARPPQAPDNEVKTS